MKPRSLRLSSVVALCCSIALLSCAEDETDDTPFDNTSTQESLNVAQVLCEKSAVEMQWFKTLLHQAATDESLRGDIYAVPVDGNILFAHQPWLMSCFGCVLYDCGGNKIDMATVDHEKVVAGMTADNRIFSGAF